MSEREMKILQAIVSMIDILLTGTVFYLRRKCLPKHIWLISERMDQAQDNGIAFFEYMNKEHPEINSYYILEKDNENLSKVNQIGKTLIQGSFKHKLYFLQSEVIASTEKNMIEPWGSRIFYKYVAKYFPKKIKVFLQHGITDKDVSSVYGKAVSPFDLFVTAAQREQAFIVERFGYLPEEVINVGFPRYDKLSRGGENHDKEKWILFMPTWRRYLNDLARDDKQYVMEAKNTFKQSQYYQAIQSFIQDKKLETLLKEEGYKMIVVTHHGMNRFKDAFSCVDGIEIYSSEEVVIAELLKKAEIFITDYSSIHFDSAYLGNINLYYQFDVEEFRNGHAQSSYFDYEKDGFGIVAYSQEALLDSLQNAIKRKGAREDQFEKRAHNFFTYTDNQNCQRLYQEIMQRKG